MSNKYFQSGIDDTKLFTEPKITVVKTETSVTKSPFHDLEERNQLLDSIRQGLRSKKDPNQKLISVGTKVPEKPVDNISPAQIIQEMFK